MALDRALEDAEQLLALAPDDSRVRLLHVRTLLLLERADEARTALLDLHQLIEEDPLAHAVETRARVCAARSRLDLEEEDPDAAFEKISDCADQFPASHVVLQEILDTHVRQKDFDAALERIRTALETEPTDTVIRYLLAEQLRHRGKLDEAEQILLDGIALFDTPRSRDWRVLYEHYWQTQDFPSAIDALERTIELIPHPATADLMLLADASIELGDLKRGEEVASQLGDGYRELILGRILIERGDDHGARENLQAGIRQWPSNPIARLLMGQVQARLGELDAALDEYTEAYRIEYGHGAPQEKTDSAKEVGRFQLALGAYDNAIDYLNVHIGAKALDTEAMELLARAAARGGRPKVGDAALSLLANSPGGFARAIAVQANLVSEATGPVAAIKAIGKWKVDLTDPANTRVLAALLTEFALAGRASAAVEYAANAARAHPESGVHLALLAQSRLRAGDAVALVRPQLDRAFELDPDNVATLMVLAEIESGQGNVGRALSHYDRVSDAKPDFLDAAVEAARLVAADAAAHEEAIRRFDLLLAQQPLESRAATGLARLALQNAQGPEDLDRALQLAERAARFSGNLSLADASQTFSVLASVHRARGDEAAALAALEVASKINGAAESAHATPAEAGSGQG
jgi:tetratricopeptide (TPR) repeat protein